MKKRKTNQSQFEHYQIYKNILNTQSMQSNHNKFNNNPFKREKSKQKLSPSKKNKQKTVISFNQNNTQKNLPSNYYNQPFYGRKHRNQDTDVKILSNQSSTHCSLNRSKKQKNFQSIAKKTKKSKQNTIDADKSKSKQKNQFIQLKPQEIMQLINRYATKIQRQWRKYWFRKCLRFIILKERENKQFQKCRQSGKYMYRQQSLNSSQEKAHKQKSKGNKSKQQIDKKIKQNQLNVSIQPSSQMIDYNFQKYGAISLESLSSRKFLNSPILVEQIHDERKNKTQQKQIQMIKSNSQSSFNQNSQYIQLKTNYKNNCKQNMQFNINQLVFNTPLTENLKEKEQQSSKKTKKMKIYDKIIDFQIFHPNSQQKNVFKNENQKNVFKNENQKNPKSQKYKQDQSIHNISSKKYLKQRQQQTSIQNFAYFQSQKMEQICVNKKYLSKTKQTDDKYPYQKMFLKCKKALQGKRLNKLLTIQSKYSNNQITHRTYERFLKEVNDRHQNQIKMIQIRQGSIKNSWNQVYKLYKQNIAKETSFIEDSKSQILQNQLQNSMCFDKWDFQSSAKKSISNVESFQDFARELNKRKQIQKQMLPKNIQEVLNQLNEIQDNSNQLQMKTQNSPTKPTQKNKNNLFQKKCLPYNIQIESTENKQQILTTTKQKIKQNHQIEHQYENSPQQKEKNVKKITSQALKEQVNLIQNKSPFIENKQILQPQIYFKQIQFNSPKIKNMNKKLLHQYYDRSETELNHSFQIEDQQIFRQSSLENKSIQFNSQQNINIFINYDKKSPIYISKDVYSSPSPKNLIVSDPQTEYLKTKFLQFVLIYRELKQKLTVKDLRQILTFCSKKKKESKLKVQKQLRKYCSIQPNIDAINQWLLQICHFLLDNHQNQIRSNLIYVKTPPQKQLLKLVQEQKCYQKSYDTISERLFKEFQFFHIKQLSKNKQVQASHYENFSTLLYGFHRCLIDGLNQTLLDQLATGRKWLMLPWISQFRCKKKITEDYTKCCLQRAINRVSNWGEYSMGQLQMNRDMTQYEWQQYLQQKMNLIITEEVLEYPVQNNIYLSSLIMKISQEVFQSEINLLIQDILLKNNKNV